MPQPLNLLSIHGVTSMDKSGWLHVLSMQLPGHSQNLIRGRHLNPNLAGTRIWALFSYAQCYSGIVKIRIALMGEEGWFCTVHSE
jgi:hypothetical protein